MKTMLSRLLKNKKPLLFLASVFICTNSFSQNFDYKNYGQFLKKYVSENGKVNYENISKGKTELTSIIKQFEKNTPKNNWSKNEKLAYWINAYNAYTIQLIINNYPLKSIKDINDPWDKEFILVENNKISLGHIEHKILRKMNEPRIHFAINCASFSCPNLKNYPFEPGKLESQLQVVAKSFLNDKTKNILSPNEIKISAIFDWFGDDFKTKGSLIDFLNGYSTTKINKNAKIIFLEYNWNLNK
jgi:ribosomal protein S18